MINHLIIMIGKDIFVVYNKYIVATLLVILFLGRGVEAQMNIKGVENCTTASTWRVGPEGGVFTTDAKAGPAKDAKVTVSQGAVEKSTEMRLLVCRRTVTLEEGRPSDSYIMLEAARLSTFQAPVLISVSYHPEGSGLVIPYRVDEAGNLYSARIGEIDRLKGRLTIWTMMPGIFTWVFP